MKKATIIILLILIFQFWRVNNISKFILDEENIEQVYLLNNYIINIDKDIKFDNLTKLEKKNLLGENKFYIIDNDNERAAYLVFNANKELIYYDRDLLCDTTIPEDFNRFKIKNNTINFFMAEKTITLDPTYWDKIDAKLVTGFAYIIHTLGLD